MGSCLKFPPGLLSMEVHNICSSDLFFVYWYKIMKTVKEHYDEYYARESHGFQGHLAGKLYDFLDQMRICSPENRNL